MFQAQLLRGKRILVTGGGSGLGREIAGQYLELGAEVYICGRRKAVLEEAAAELMAEHGGKVKTHRARHSQRGRRWTRWSMRSGRDGGPLDGLVNNAAGNFISRTEDISPRGFDAVANIGAHGTYYMTHQVGSRWIADGHQGSVISIVVTWVRTGAPFVVPSAMCKAGIDVMTKSLAIEWGPLRHPPQRDRAWHFPTEGASKRLSPKAAVGRRRGAQPHEPPGPHVGVAEPGRVPDGRRRRWLSGETIAIDGAGPPKRRFVYRTGRPDDHARARDRGAIRNHDQGKVAAGTPRPSAARAPARRPSPGLSNERLPFSIDRIVDAVVAQGRGDHPALVLEDGTVLSYGALDQRITAARRWPALGWPAGHRMMLVGEQRPTWWWPCWPACLRAGGRFP